MTAPIAVVSVQGENIPEMQLSGFSVGKIASLLSKLGASYVHTTSAGFTGNSPIPRV